MSKQNKDKDINIGNFSISDAFKGGAEHGDKGKPEPPPPVATHYSTEYLSYTTEYDPRPPPPYGRYGYPRYHHRPPKMQPTYEHGAYAYPAPQQQPKPTPAIEEGNPLPPQPAAPGEAYDRPKDQKPDHRPATYNPPRKQPPMDLAGWDGYPPPPCDEEAYGYPYPPPQHPYGYPPRHSGRGGYYHDGYPTVQGGGPHMGMGRIPAGVAAAYDTYGHYRQYGRHGGGDYGGGYRHGYGHQGKFKHAHQGKYSHYYGRHDGGYYN